MKHLDLFSGIGGFAIAARWAGIETVGFCEIEECRWEELKKNFPGVRIHSDIKTLKGDEFGEIDLITGGFPCQPFSVAGRKKGTKDDRDLWPEMFRVIQQAKPSWIVGENVANFTEMAFTRTKINLESEGYTVQPFIIPACSVGAKHKRDRVWIVAHSPHIKRGRSKSGSIGENGEGELQTTLRGNNTIRPKRSSEAPKIISGSSIQHPERNGQSPSEGPGSSEEAIRQQPCGTVGTLNLEGASGLPSTEGDVSDTMCIRSSRGRHERCTKGPTGLCCGERSDKEQPLSDMHSSGLQKKGPKQQTTRIEHDRTGKGWPTEPAVGRVAHGVPRRVDRIKGLGNAIVPQVAYEIMRAIVIQEE